MDTAQIETALGKLFHEQDQRIVFWNDPEMEFSLLLPAVRLEGVKVLRLDQCGAFEAKLRLERDDSNGKYLIYSPKEEPDYEDDWLLDVRLYSRSFRADRASILLSDLGLANQSLRPYLADRRKFFDAKDRQRKLQALVTADDTEIDLDRKMLAVVIKAEQPELFTILRTLFHAFTEGGGESVELGEPPAVWQQVEKFDLEKPFWGMIKASFGYSEETPTLKNLLIWMLVTDFAQHLKGDVPAALSHLVLSKAYRPNTVVCLAQWRDSASRGGSYDLLSMAVSRLVGIEDHLHASEVESLLDVMTFLDVEKAVASGLRDRVISTTETINADEVRQVAARRQAGHWASLGMATSAGVAREAFHAIYDALVTAADFFGLLNRYRAGFDFDNPKSMYAAYEADLYRFDQLYRHFCEAADEAQAKGWEILKKLRDQVEASYVTGYLTKIALAWGKFVDPAGSTALLDKWQIDHVSSQYGFFTKWVRNQLAHGEYKRVFVIVSDAFRYEAAAELVRELNGKYRFEAELSSQLSVLPSYTALGMASLLPHKTLSYKLTGEVLVDGLPTSGLAQRDEILASVNGMAIRADDLMAMRRDEGRERVKAKEVIYVYHDTVDAIGDKQATEKDTFAAVRTSINELSSLVGHVINNLNGYFVVITADHGFLFTESAPHQTAKSALSDKPPGTVVAKKRYLLGHGLPDSDEAWHGSTAITTKAEGGMEFWIPKGINRFHFTGGARFVHGGAMLQEVVVPVVAVRHVKGKGAEKTEVKQVPVHVLGTKHKITTSRHRFELIQMEAVSERVRPVTLKVAVYEGGEAVTKIESVTFDSTSGNMDERKKWVQLVLKDRQYDKKIAYRLVLRDAETGFEHQSIEVVVDRAFADDF